MNAVDRENRDTLTKPLTIEQIAFRVQSINKGGYATILAYKDARVDMHRLNEVFGPGKWQRKHDLIGGEMFCSVGTWSDDIKQWAWVQDVGTESSAEKKKGQASDSFKRACFNLGIGIELYDYPMISVKLNPDEWTKVGDKPKATWNLRLRDWKWESVFTDGKITFLQAKEKGIARYTWMDEAHTESEERKLSKLRALWTDLCSNLNAAGLEGLERQMIWIQDREGFEMISQPGDITAEQYTTLIKLAKEIK